VFPVVGAGAYGWAAGAVARAAGQALDRVREEGATGVGLVRLVLASGPALGGVYAGLSCARALTRVRGAVSGRHRAMD
jgi:hypothetical protein